MEISNVQPEDDRWSKVSLSHEIAKNSSGDEIPEHDRRTDIRTDRCTVDTTYDLWDDLPPCKNGDLQSIFAHSTSAVIAKKVIISQIRSQIRAFQWWTACVAPKPPKGGSRMKIHRAVSSVSKNTRYSREVSRDFTLHRQWISNQRTLNWIAKYILRMYLCITHSFSLTSANIAMIHR